MMGGGMISTHIKRGRMDDAQSALTEAGRHLKRFQKELEDVKMAVHADLELGDYYPLQTTSSIISSWTGWCRTKSEKPNRRWKRAVLPSVVHCMC